MYSYTSLILWDMILVLVSSLVRRTVLVPCSRAVVIISQLCSILSPSTDIPNSNPSSIRGNYQEVSINVHHGHNALRTCEQLFGGTLLVGSHRTHNTVKLLII